jgi:hypothetical protein
MFVIINIIAADGGVGFVVVVDDKKSLIYKHS